ncbi:MAG: hypothetical protein VX730_08680 [Pseudomonadota bacterium]|nr:hypothetical protein [Pseudomonadota bacterium]
MSELTPFDCQQLSIGVGDSFVNNVKVAMGEWAQEFQKRGAVAASKIMGDLFRDLVNEMRGHAALVEASKNALQGHAEFQAAREEFQHTIDMINMLDVEDPLTPEMEELFGNLELIESVYQELQRL